jgi:hypothetical protein
MPKYTLLSRVYLGDEELYELLSPKNVPRRELLRAARRLGFVFSEKSREQDVRSALSLLPSSWPLVSGVLKSIEKPDREERKTSVHVLNCDKKTDVAEIIKKTQTARAEKFSEFYNPVKVDEKTYKVDVTYTEVDYSRAVVYQRQEKQLTVEITKDGDKVSFIHSANDRAMHIVNELKSKLIFKENVAPEIQRISLQAVRDPSVRTRFFTELIKSLDGYKYLNATQLNVDRRFPSEETENEGDEVDDESEEVVATASTKRVSEKIKGLVHQVALRGEQVLADELYQTVEKSGYYISNISWSCKKTIDPRYGIDCVAGFKDPIQADAFSFDVVRAWQYKSGAPDEEETLRTTEPERRKLNRLLEASALKAFDTIVKAGRKTADKAPAKI